MSGYVEALRQSLGKSLTDLCEIIHILSGVRTDLEFVHELVAEIDPDQLENAIANVEAAKERIKEINGMLG